MVLEEATTLVVDWNIIAIVAAAALVALVAILILPGWWRNRGIKKGRELIEGQDYSATPIAHTNRKIPRETVEDNREENPNLAILNNIRRN
jgi:hypothetical protein